MRVVPIASGKGGVGKTLIAANLAIALARNDRRVILADLDLGGSNLHLVLGTDFGATGSVGGVGTFLSRTETELERFVQPTEYDNLGFISGDGEIPGLANLQANQKRRLLSHLGKLDCDYLVLDLGAGTNFNTLDFFLLAGRGLVVATPTPTSTVNAYLFLKNAVFRILHNAIPKKSAAGSYLEDLRKDGSPLRTTYIPQLLEKLQEIDPERHARCTERLEHFAPRLVLNMLEDPKDSQKAGKLRRSCRQYLGIELEHLGIVYRDDLQDVALSSRLPIIRYKPQSVLSQAIYRIADKLISAEEDAVRELDLGNIEEVVDESYQEANLEAEADFATKTSYVEDLLHTGALSTGDLIETIKMQQIELTHMRKENNLLKSKLVRAMKQGYRKE